MNWVLAFLPIGLQVLAATLIGRDRNDTGADDAYGRLLMELSPVVPQLISGQAVSDTATDKVFLAIKKVADTYLIQRGKLLFTTNEPKVTE